MRGSDYYRIRVHGHLPDSWSRWFEGLEISRQPDGSTVLEGPLGDQSALQGMLLKVFNLGLSLESVERLQRGVDTI
ncbi:MAG TPA: hypothetical protein VK879_19450 [Candidatus Sulfomarinibacteraceae bacterium]|nr:hypothetical protein [Candidatus Sulfomarinibacteraceae bacterium]